jgi:hypothetical protein
MIQDAVGRAMLELAVPKMRPALRQVALMHFACR